MKQIVIAMKGKYFNLPDIFWQQTRTFRETRLRDKELWDPGYTAKTDTILKKKLRRLLKSFCNYDLKWYMSIIIILSSTDLSARATLQT